MAELIIIKTDNGRSIKKWLQEKHIVYETYREPKKSFKKNIFAHYDQAIQNKKRDKELELWDNTDSDEELNLDGEWWS